MQFVLIRERDGLTRQSNDVIWVEWNEDKTFKEKYEEPAVGRSLMLGPLNMLYTWLTTPITEILEQKDDYIKFKTLNSTYELLSVKEKK